MSNKKDKTVELEKLVESLKEDNLKGRNEIISLKDQVATLKEQVEALIVDSLDQDSNSEEVESLTSDLALAQGKFLDLHKVNEEAISTIGSLEGRLKEALQANEECVAVAGPSEEELQKRGPREGHRFVSGKNGKGLVEVKV